MALPVTITGISTAVAPVGPFKTTFGTIYSIVTTFGSFIGLGFPGGTSSVAASQSFTVPASGTFTLTQALVYLGKSGAPTGTVVANLYLTDGAGAPVGTSLATSSTTVAAATLVSSAFSFSFAFASIPLTNNTQYAIVLSFTGTTDSTNYYRFYTGNNSVDAAQTNGYYNGSSWTVDGKDCYLLVSGTGVNGYYFFGRDGTTATTLQAFKSTAPDTSWASIATRTGFTTAILNLAAWQVGNVIHLLVQDGTASTALATKYVSFDALTDTFLATTETVSAAVAVTGQVAGVGAGASLVVRSNGNVVAFYSGVQSKTSGTFRARVYYRERTALNTWGTETQVDGNTAVDNVIPISILGAANRVHFVWASPTNVNNRTLSAANAQNTATTSASLASPGDGVSYDRAGTTKVVVTSNATGQTVQRFDSSDNPTASYSTPTAANATLPHRIGTFPNTDDVTIVYRNSADSDLYSIKSSDDGATFGTAVSFFVGTVASADANVSRSSSGSVYARGSNNVVGYLVNDNGTLKYNENVVGIASPTITASALPIVGQTITGIYVAGSVAYSDTITPAALSINGAALADALVVALRAVVSWVELSATQAVVNYSDTITPSSVPIVGQTITPVFAAGVTGINYTDTLSPSSVPISGATIAPVYTANYADTLTASALPIVGATLAPVYTARYADTLTAGALPVGGLTITPLFSVGGINYSDTIAASSVPVVGATLSPVYTARYTDAISASTVPIGGAALADAYGRSDTLAASAVPIGGQAVAPVYTARYADTIAAGAVPLTGRTITPVFSAGAINYTDTISPSALPIGGRTIAPFYTVNTTDTIGAAALPVSGVALADLFAIRDTIAASELRLVGQTITPVAHLKDSPIKSYGIVAIQTEPGIIIGQRELAALTGKRTPPVTITGQQNISAIVGKRTAPATWDARQ